MRTDWQIRLSGNVWYIRLRKVPPHLCSIPGMQQQLHQAAKVHVILNSHAQLRGRLPLQLQVELGITLVARLQPCQAPGIGTRELKARRPRVEAPPLLPVACRVPLICRAAGCGRPPPPPLCSTVIVTHRENFEYLLHKARAFKATLRESSVSACGGISKAEERSGKSQEAPTESYWASKMSRPLLDCRNGCVFCKAPAKQRSRHLTKHALRFKVRSRHCHLHACRRMLT